MREFILFLCLLLFMLLCCENNNKEYFNNNNHPWSQNILNRFILYQNTVNKNNIQYNLELLQKQCSEKDVLFFLENGYWYWSDDLKKMYLENVSKNTMISINPYYALEYAMKNYNQTAARHLIYWNNKIKKHSYSNW